MTAAMVFVILTLVIPLSLVFINRLREDTAALLMVAALMIAQIAGLPVLGSDGNTNAIEAALKGFGSPTIFTLIALFILTASLEKYGLTSWIASKLVSIGGKSERKLIGLFSISAALLSMIINNLAAGALLLPSALEAARRSGIKPSKLLIPIAYGSMLGGASFYLSTANIISSGLLEAALPPQKPLGILDFTPTGGLVAIAGLAFLTIFGKYLLPDNEPPTVYKIPGSRGLTSTYHLQERLWEASIPLGSPFIHQTLGDTNLGKDYGIAVIAVRRNQRIMPIDHAGFILEAGDTLILIGREERVIKLSDLGMILSKSITETSYESSDLVFAEIIVPPRSSGLGKNLRELAFRARSGFSAIALWRDNRSYRTDVADFCLESGDTLLLIGPGENLDRLRKMEEFFLVESAVSRNSMDQPKVLLTTLITAGAILAMILGVPVIVAMLSAAVIILLTRLISMEEAYQVIKWRAIFMIAGIMSVSTAMVQTGLADLIGKSIVTVIQPFGGLGLAVGGILLTAGLSQVMGSQITPLATGPIILSAAINLGVNTQAMAVAIGVSTAIFFLTPLAHPVNLIMIAPGSYSFKDFFRIGIWISLVCFLALILAMKIFWNI